MSVRIICISDTHLRHLRCDLGVPDGDLLIHAGDAMIEGTEAEARAFFEWFEGLPHGRKVFVAGNHDVLFEKNSKLARRLIPPGVTYLQDEAAVILGLKIYGSPWTPEFMNWAFNLPRGGRLAEKWAAIPKGLDILVTHGPPQGTLDQVLGTHEHLGCYDLELAVQHAQPRVHIFGHIHSGHGIVKRPLKDNDAIAINAALCDETYMPRYQPIVLDLEPRKGP